MILPIHAPKGRLFSRCQFCSLPDDDRRTKPDHTTNDHLLRLAAHITCDQAQSQNERTLIRSGEVAAHTPSQRSVDNPDRATHKQINLATYAFSGANRNPSPPAIVGIMNSMQTSVRLFFGSRSLRKAPVKMKIMTSAPCGSAIREVSRVLKPNPLMTSVEKLEIPPFGMFCTRTSVMKPMTTKSHIHRSSRARRRSRSCNPRTPLESASS